MSYFYKYLCPYCFDSFVEKTAHTDWFCSSCGFDLVYIPMKVAKEQAESSK